MMVAEILIFVPSVARFREDFLLSRLERAQIASLAEGAPTIRFENRHHKSDGSWCWLEWNAMPVADEDRFYAIARDINNRRAQEEELRRQRDLAEGTIFTGMFTQGLHPEET